MEYPSCNGMLRPGGLGLTARGLALARFAPNARLLDVACGNGATLAFLRNQGYAAQGIDHDPSRAASVENAALAQAESLPYGDNTFDGILMECCLCDFEQPQTALTEAARVLAHGGKLLLSDLYARQPVPLTAQAPRFRLYDQPTLHAWLAQAGFSLDHFEDHSPALAAFCGQLLLSGGSGALARIGLDLPALKAAGCGYYLVIAAKAAP